MMTMLLDVGFYLMQLFGLYVALLIVILSAAFALAGVWVVVDNAWAWAVRRIRRWRLARDLDREREDHRLRSVALTGTKGVPRRTWEAGEPPEGPTRVA